MIYGEEAIIVPFNKGLWFSSTPDTIPDGYCMEFINLEVDAEGNVFTRGALEPIAGTSFTTPNTSTSKRSFFPGFGENELRHDYWRTTVGTAYQYVVAHSTGGQEYLHVVSSSAESSLSSIMSNPNDFPSDMCQYRDRIYFLAERISTVVRVNNPNLQNSPVVTTAVQAFSEAGIRLLVFKDRMFYFTKTRVYYTEIAAVGGFAETWNISTNFLVMPSAGSFIITAEVLNDRIFIFTADGTYSLTADGSPTTWRLENNNQAVVIKSIRQLCVAQNNFIYTDDNTVYMWPGYGNPAEIGQPISRWIKAYNRTRVMPYRKGILVTMVSWQGAGPSYTPIYLHFYFTGEYWTEIRKSTNTFAFVASFPNAPTYPSLNQTGPSNTYPLAAEDNLLVSNETYFYAVNGLQTGGFTASFITKDVVSPAWEIIKRYKYAYLQLLNLEQTGTATYIYYTQIEGLPSGTSQGDFTPAIVSSDRNYTIKLRAPQTANRIAYKFSATMPDVVLTSASRIPILKFKNLRLILNTDNRNSPERSTP